MRDAQSLLDQVISYSSEAADGGQIGEAEALTILGIVPAESYVRQFRNIASGEFRRDNRRDRACRRHGR